jgi:acyl CoA:acetate/3-ketoacid CoA transferase
MPLSLDGTTGISASGNVTAAYLFGDASGLTGFSPITESEQTITANKTITAGYNGQSVGPVTMQSGVAVTVGTDQRWIIWG